MSILLSIFLLGLSVGAGPCMASCGPVLVPYFAQAPLKPLEAVRKYAVFSLGRILVYSGLGAAIFLVGKMATQVFLESTFGYVTFFGGVIICMLGVLSIFGRHSGPRFCAFLEKHRPRIDTGNLFLLGIVMGLAPCGPVLVLLASAALVSKHLALTVGYCLVFGLGTTISPLALICVFASGSSQFLRNRNMFWQRILDYLCGSIMIFIGIQFLLRAKG